MQTGGGGFVLRILILCLLFSPAMSALPLVDQEHGFRAEVPDSLPAAQIDKARFPNTVHMFAEPERGGVVLQFVLLPEELQQGTSAAMGPRDMKVNWKGHTLIRHLRTLSPGTAHAATELYADVPVAKRAIRIALTGPVKREPELVGLFTSVLERFDAQSNWKSGAEGASGLPPPTPIGDEPAKEIDDGMPTALAGLAVTLALVLGFAAGWWLRGQGVAAPPAVAGLAVAVKPEAPRLPPAAKAEPVVAPPVTAPAPQKAPAPDATPRCRVCGVEVRAGRKKCMNCGSEIF